MNDHPFRLNVAGAFLRRADLSGTRLKDANLAGADFRNALFRDADFQDAILDGTILVGADLTGARNLTVQQLKRAVIDRTTVLPAYLGADAYPADR